MFKLILWPQAGLGRASSLLGAQVRCRPRECVGQSRRAGPSIVRMAARLDLIAAAAMRGCSARLGVDDLPDVDIAGAEARLAIREVVFPHATEALVEAEMNEARPSVKEANPPLRKGDGVVEPEHALVARGEADRSPSDFMMPGEGSMPPGKM